jgi:hypothetical protein
MEYLVNGKPFENRAPSMVKLAVVQKSSIGYTAKLFGFAKSVDGCSQRINSTNGKFGFREQIKHSYRSEVTSVITVQLW